MDVLICTLILAVRPAARCFGYWTDIQHEPHVPAPSSFRLTLATTDLHASTNK